MILKKIKFQFVILIIIFSFPAFGEYTHAEYDIVGVHFATKNDLLYEVDNTTYERSGPPGRDYGYLCQTLYSMSEETGEKLGIGLGGLSTLAVTNLSLPRSISRPNGSWELHEDELEVTADRTRIGPISEKHVMLVKEDSFQNEQVTVYGYGHFLGTIYRDKLSSTCEIEEFSISGRSFDVDKISYNNKTTITYGGLTIPLPVLANPAASNSSMAYYIDPIQNDEAYDNHALKVEITKILLTPIYEKLSKNLSQDLRDDDTLGDDHYLIRETNNQDSYSDYVREVLQNPDLVSDEFGIIHNFVGKSSQDINNILARFIFTKIDGSLLNKSNLYFEEKIKPLLQKTLFGMLKQDYQHPYGSLENLKATIAIRLNPHINENTLKYYENDSLLLQEYDALVLQSFLDAEKDQISDSINPEEFLVYLYASVKYGWDIKNPISFINGIFTESLVDHDRGILTSLEYKGKTLLGITELALGNEENEDLFRIKILMTKMALEELNIDTLYPYGSIDNVKATIIRRHLRALDNTSSEHSFLDTVKQFGEENFPALFDQLVQEEGQHHLKDLAVGLFFRIHDDSRRKSASEFASDDRKNRYFNFYSSIAGVYDSVSNLVSLIEDKPGDDDDVYGLTVTRKSVATAQLTMYGASNQYIEKNWEKYIDQGTLGLLHRGQSGEEIDRLIHAEYDWLTSRGYSETHSVTSLWRQKFSDNMRALSKVLAYQTVQRLADDGKIPILSSYTPDALTPHGIKVRLHSGFKYKRPVRVGYASSSTRTGGAQSREVEYEEFTENRKLLITTAHRDSLPGIVIPYASLHSASIGKDLSYTPDILGLNFVDTYIDSDGDYTRHQIDSGMIKYFNAMGTGISARNNSCYDQSLVTPPTFTCPSLYGQCRFLEPLLNVDCAFDNMYYTTSEGNLLSQLESLYYDRLYADLENYKSITTPNEIFVEVIKSIVPIWSVVESFEEGDAAGATLGVVSTVISFVPIAGPSLRAVAGTINVGRTIAKVTKTVARLGRLAKVAKATTFLLKQNGRAVVAVSKVNKAAGVAKVKTVLVGTLKTAIKNLTPAGDLLDLVSIVRGVPKLLRRSLFSKLLHRKSLLKHAAKYKRNSRTIEPLRVNMVVDDDVPFGDLYSTIPSSHRRSFAEIADVENVIIGVRPASKDSISIIESGIEAGLYAKKSIHIKAKSKRVGPIFGLIPVDYAPSRIDFVESLIPLVWFTPLKIRKYNALAEEVGNIESRILAEYSIREGHAVSVQLTMTRDRINEYVNEGLMSRLRNTDAPILDDNGRVTNSDSTPFRFPDSPILLHPGESFWRMYEEVPTNPNSSPVILVTQDSVIDNSSVRTVYTTPQGVHFIFEPIDASDQNSLVYYVGKEGYSQPLNVLADPVSLKPMASNYELMTVISEERSGLYRRHSSDSWASLRRENLQASWANFRERVELSFGSHTYIPDEYRTVYDDESVYYSTLESSELKSVSESVRLLINNLHQRIGRSVGFELVHHGSDETNPSLVVDDDFPAIFFTPSWMANTAIFSKNADGHIVIENRKQLVKFYQYALNHYYVGGNNSNSLIPNWYAEAIIRVQ